MINKLVSLFQKAILHLRYLLHLNKLEKCVFVNNCVFKKRHMSQLFEELDRLELAESQTSTEEEPSKDE